MPNDIIVTPPPLEEVSLTIQQAFKLIAKLTSPGEQFMIGTNNYVARGRASSPIVIRNRDGRIETKSSALGQPGQATFWASAEMLAHTRGYFVVQTDGRLRYMQDSDPPE